MLTYKEFIKDYRKTHKGKVTFKEIGAEWKTYKAYTSQKTKPLKERIREEMMEKPEEKPVFEKPEIEITPQEEGGILQEKPAVPETLPLPETTVSRNELQELLQDSPPKEELEESLDIDAEYHLLSESVHGLAAGFVEDYTEGRVKIEDKKLTTLNKMGALLLKKHDKDRVIAKHGIEFTYCIAILNIFREIRRDLRQRQREEAKIKEQKIIQTEVIPNATVQEQSA